MNLLTTKKPKRQGFTLIEVGIAATISSLLAALGIALIYSLISVNSATKVQADQQRIVARLAETLRADTHCADSAKIEDETAKVKRLVLKQSTERSVEYTLADGEIFRRVHSGEKQVAVDSFLLPAGMTFCVSLESAGQKTLVVLELNPSSEEKKCRRLAPMVAAVGTSPALMEISLPAKEEEVVAASEENSPETQAKPGETPDENAKPEAEEGASE